MPRRAPTSSLDSTTGIGFLFSQVASHASARFAARLKPLGFKPTHAGVISVIADADGLSQQTLGELIGMFPSRLVGLIDELEKRGLVERRNSLSDRRSYALYLTIEGRSALKQIGQVAREHQDEIFAALNNAEKTQIVRLLRRIAAEQGLKPGVHPGLGKTGGDESNVS